ncbi:unnamed protein product [Sympodiomycopsis kandeliae]
MLLRSALYLPRLRLLTHCTRLRAVSSTIPSYCNRFHSSGTSMSSAKPSSSFFSNRVASKTVLITGASSGIGESTALLFASLGANVILTARRLDVLKEVEKQVQKVASDNGHNIKSHVVDLDVQNRKEIDRFVESRLPSWAVNKIDILVNNAGLVLGTSQVGDIDPEEIDTMVQTNVIGLIHLTQLLVKDFKARNHPGHIIQLGSVAGRLAYPGGSIYCATKFAVKAFTQALHRELVDTNIRVSEVQPGMVETNFSVIRYRGDKEAADNVYKGVEALTPQDIAEEIVWIANRPAHVNVGELFVTPVQQASPFHLSRRQ